MMITYESRMASCRSAPALPLATRHGAWGAARQRGRRGRRGGPLGAGALLLSACSARPGRPQGRHPLGSGARWVAYPPAADGRSVPIRSDQSAGGSWWGCDGDVPLMSLRGEEWRGEERRGRVGALRPEPCAVPGPGAGLRSWHPPKATIHSHPAPPTHSPNTEAAEQFIQTLYLQYELKGVLVVCLQETALILVLFFSLDLNQVRQCNNFSTGVEEKFFVKIFAAMPQSY